MAGTGKRGDAKKPSIWGKRYFGKKGFKPGTSSDVKIINVGELDQKLEKLLLLKKIEQKGSAYVVDLTKLGYDKLLSKGKATKAMEINIYNATEKAISKVSEAGGKVIMPEEEKASAEPAKEKLPAEETKKEAPTEEPSAAVEEQ